MHALSRYPDWLSRGTNHRWLIVVASVLINPALGVRHVWSVFGSPLATTFHWNPLTTTAPLIASTVAFAVLMIPAGSWTVIPAHIAQRFNATQGLDPILRTVDGSNAPLADVSMVQARLQAYSMLLNNGVIRVGIGIPAGAEFTLSSPPNRTIFSAP